MNPKIANIKNKLTPTKIIVVLFILGVSLWFINRTYPFGGDWFMPVYYAITAIAAGAFIWQCVLSARLIMKWRQAARTQRHQQPRP